MNAVVDGRELELIDRDPGQVIVQPRAALSPSQLVQIAVERGADLAYVEKLMELQERHEANEARRALNVALSAFKAEAVRIIKTKQIKDGPLKGKFHAELASVVNAVTPVLSKHGLSIAWSLTEDARDWMQVTCTLRHVGGHCETVSMGGPPDAGPGRNAMQARGSTKTYLERYTATAILGLAAQDADDDGAGGLGETALLGQLLDQLKTIETDEQALAFWKDKRVLLKDNQRDYDRFKDEVGACRTQLKGKQP